MRLFYYPVLDFKTIVDDNLNDIHNLETSLSVIKYNIFENRNKSKWHVCFNRP
ncbi:hypothetical protein NARC_30105 [Candidatus Nitrosocosmicus arcticus]|uniref:Uncharacterized protein n=1 Tax=Candidatus Nitrosocosmicus arcticus TaxID=2035267 RepID=A0A557SXR6_9ARCH|nr:hypothetical protein NARC_30105 [Candidatus Nitrosocosmicus arcticus]